MVVFSIGGSGMICWGGSVAVVWGGTVVSVREGGLVGAFTNRRFFLHVYTTFSDMVISKVLFVVVEGIGMAVMRFMAIGGSVCWIG